VGENFTTNVHFAPPANEAAQGVTPPVAAEKSPLAVNAMLIAAAVLLVRVTVAKPLLLPTVTFPKATLVGPRVNGTIPAPETSKTSGVTVVPFTRPIPPGIDPVVDGVKVTVNVQLASEAKVVTQPDAL
jgi:hypothetical protein